MTTSIFQPFYFLKLCPIFDELLADGFTKFADFIWVQYIFGQKSCYLGPTIFEIPQPNWHLVQVSKTKKCKFDQFIIHA